MKPNQDKPEDDTLYIPVPFDPYWHPTNQDKHSHTFHRVMEVNGEEHQECECGATHWDSQDELRDVHYLMTKASDKETADHYMKVINAHTSKAVTEAQEELASYFITAAGGEVTFTRKMLEEMPLGGQTVCREVSLDGTTKYWLELDMLTHQTEGKQ